MKEPVILSESEFDSKVVPATFNLLLPKNEPFVGYSLEPLSVLANTLKNIYIKKIVKILSYATELFVCTQQEAQTGTQAKTQLNSPLKISSE